MEVVTVRAAKGRRVLDPRTRAPVPDEGKGVRVPLDSYWVRRIACGDAERVEAPKARKDDR